ncbi:MAG: Ig-like domain-containing protein [Lachnospiraceae bacterium]|nr:Ig-like domain-containing protein [Lachnospiraceae bacterium]
MGKFSALWKKATGCVGAVVLLCLLMLGRAGAEEITILPGQTDEPSDGCEWVAMYGDFGSNAAEALARINEIRWEACHEGVPDPRDSSRNLKEADYVPIKWSTELEKMARLRAVEAGFIRDHARHNGKSIWTAAYGVTSYGEVIAWNGSINMVPGVNQWYSEKQDWLDACAGLEHDETGHYTQMINPNNIYVGLGLFKAQGIWYGSALVGEFTSYGSGLSETFLQTYTGVYQKFDVKKEYLGAYTLSVPGDICVGQQRTAMTNVAFTRAGRTFTVRYMGAVQYTSDNTTVLTVDQSGKMTGKKAGTANITASVGGTQIGTTQVTVVGGYNIADVTVTLSENRFQYDGTAKIPTVTITHNGGLLVAGTDYTIGFSNNVNVGTAKATITGKGFYSGTKEVTYTIFCDHQGNFTRVAGEDKMEGDCTICHAHVELPLPTYMTFWWKNELETGNYSSGTPWDNPVGTDILCWFAEIDGDARYSEIVIECSDPSKLSVPAGAPGPDYEDLHFKVLGSGEVTVTIYPKWNPERKRTYHLLLGTPDVAEADITLTSTATYTGEPLTPSVTVRVAGKLMTKDKDYTVSYRDNINAGTATVTITGIGGLTGTTTRTFRVIPKQLDTTVYTCEGVSAVLNGEIEMSFYIVPNASAYEDVANRDPYILFYTDKREIAKLYLKDMQTDVSNGKTRYRAICPVVAKELSDPIKIAFFVNDNVQAKAIKQYTPKYYFQTLANGSYSAEIKALAKAIITYSAYAREYFNYETDSLADTDYKTDIPAKQTVIAAISGDITIGNPSGRVSFDGISLLILSDTGMRFYFTPDASVLAGDSRFGKASNGQYYIPVSGATLGNLATVRAITVDGMTVTASPLHYIKSVLRYSDNPKLINLCLAMYECYIAAQAYIG